MSGITPALRTQMEYVKSCLSTGFTAAEIARALSVTEAYVSQIVQKIKEEDALAPVTAAQMAPAARSPVTDKTIKIDELYEDVEYLAVSQLRKVIPHVVNPDKLTNILSRINATKRRSHAVPSNNGGSGSDSGGIRIQLPPRAKAVFVFSSDNQAIETVVTKPTEIEGEVIDVTERRSLITANVDQLDALVDVFKTQQALEKQNEKEQALVKLTAQDLQLT